MMMKTHVLVSVISLALLASYQVLANNPATDKVSNVGCSDKMKEQVILSVMANTKAASLNEAKQKHEDWMKKIEQFAKQHKISELQVQNANYSINQNYEYEGAPSPFYTLNSTMSYALSDSEAAIKFGEVLTQNKFQVNLSVNKYHENPCL